MSATRVHFTSPVQGGPGWFESYIKFFSRAQSADTGHRIKGFCMVNNIPFQIKIQIFALQFMNVAAQGGGGGGRVSSDKFNPETSGKNQKENYRNF